MHIPLIFSFTLFTSNGFSKFDGNSKKQQPLAPHIIVITIKYNNGDYYTNTKPNTFPTIYDDYINAQNIPKYLPLVSFVLIFVIYHGYETHSVLAQIPFIIAQILTIMYNTDFSHTPLWLSLQWFT